MVVLPILWTVSLAFQRLPAAQPAQHPACSATTPWTTSPASSPRPGFWSSLGTTLVYSVCGTASAIGVGLVAALALRRPFRGRGLVRGCMLLPYVAPVVAVTFVWKTMLNPQFGVVNHWGTRCSAGHARSRSCQPSGRPACSGIPRRAAHGDRVRGLALFPFAFLFLTARLQAIPAALEEAAKVDGATLSQRFRYVVLPQLLPTIARADRAAVHLDVQQLRRHLPAHRRWRRHPGGRGRVYDYLTTRGDIGAAAAQALVLAAILAVLVTLYLKRAGRARSH